MFSFDVLVSNFKALLLASSIVLTTSAESSNFEMDSDDLEFT